MLPLYLLGYLPVLVDCLRSCVYVFRMGFVFLGGETRSQHPRIGPNRAICKSYRHPAGLAGGMDTKLNMRTRRHRIFKLIPQVYLLKILKFKSQWPWPKGQWCGFFFFSLLLSLSLSPALSPFLFYLVIFHGFESWTFHSVSVPSVLYNFNKVLMTVKWISFSLRQTAQFSVKPLQVQYDS